MKRPTWATIVGVLGIIFAIFGILGAGSDIMMPATIDFQKKMFSQMEAVQQKMATTENGNPIPDEAFTGMLQSMQSMWEMPEWLGTWSMATGLFKLLLCGLALFAGISLLQVKPYAIKVFYWAAGLNIGLFFIKGAVLLASMSLMAMTMLFGSFFGLVVNTVLIIVVALGDKTPFNQKVPATA